jgi:hypothetical protein
MKQTIRRMAFCACACLWLAGVSVSAPVAVPVPSVPETVLPLSGSAQVTLAWPDEGERRRWFPERGKAFVLLRLDRVAEGDHQFLFLEREPFSEPWAKSKARYRFRATGPDRPWDFSLDLGRRIPAHWLKLPKGSKLKKGQWLKLSADPDQSLDFAISDAVLKHYPPMSFRQKKASRALVEAAAKEMGRK